MQWLTFGPAGVPRRHRRHGGVCLFGVVAGLLAALGVPGVSRSTALAASSSSLTWTQQAPATSPVGRGDASMAYDAATGKVVLFGGHTLITSCSVIPGPGAVPPGLGSIPQPTREPSGARRWPTTPPTAPWSYSAAISGMPNSTVLGLGRFHLDSAAPATHPPGRWEVSNSMVYARPPPTSSCSAAMARRASSAIPGPGTVPPGFSSIPRPARQRGGDVDGLRRGPGNVVLFGGWGGALGVLGDPGSGTVPPGSSSIRDQPASPV